MEDKKYKNYTKFKTIKPWDLINYTQVNAEKMAEKKTKEGSGR